jgi:hypothetical protein
MLAVCGCLRVRYLVVLQPGGSKLHAGFTRLNTAITSAGDELLAVPERNNRESVPRRLVPTRRLAAREHDRLRHRHPGNASPQAGRSRRLVCGDMGRALWTCRSDRQTGKADKFGNGRRIVGRGTSRHGRVPSWLIYPEPRGLADAGLPWAGVRSYRRLSRDEFAACSRELERVGQPFDAT